MSLVKQALIFVLAHLAAAAWFVLDRAPGTAAAWYGLPLDDAWIHLVYARSLAALEGFAYNPGQLETGATSPLWAVGLVPATWLARALGTSVVVLAKLTSLVAGIGASVAAAWLARALRLGVAVELAAGLAVALDPALAFAQVSGMEVMLAAALALWAVAELAAERTWPAAVAAGLAPLARPELAMLTLPVLAVLEWRLHRAGAPLARRALVLLPALLCVGGWVTYCLAVSGRPLPSTYYAKLVLRAELVGPQLALVFGGVLPSWPWFSRGTGFVLFAVGAVLLWRRGLAGKLAVVLPIAYLLAAASSQHLPQGWPFYWQRYLLPPLPFLLLGVVLGAAEVVAWAWRHRRASWAPGRALVAAALLLGAVAAWPAAWRASANRFAWNCQNIEELDVAMARWLAANVPAGQTVAVIDAGAVRYFARGPVIDLLGLNHHRLLHRVPGALDIERIAVVSTFPGSLPLLRELSSWRPVHRVAAGRLTICDCPRQSELVAYQRVR